MIDVHIKPHLSHNLVTYICGFKSHLSQACFYSVEAGLIPCVCDVDIGMVFILRVEWWLHLRVDVKRFGGEGFLV